MPSLLYGSYRPLPFRYSSCTNCNAPQLDPVTTQAAQCCSSSERSACCEALLSHSPAGQELWQPWLRSPLWGGQGLPMTQVRHRQKRAGLCKPVPASSSPARMIVAQQFRLYVGVRKHRGNKGTVRARCENCDLHVRGLSGRCLHLNERISRE